MRITNEVIQSYIECKYKSYLLFTGTEETSSEYENFMKELLSAYRTDVTRKYFVGNQLDLAKQKYILTELNIKTLPDFLFNSTIKSGPYEIHYDALKKLEQKSSTRKMLYSPLYFVSDDTICEKHKLYVAVIGFLLGKVQKEEPDKGIIVHGKIQKSRYVKLHKYRSSGRYPRASPWVSTLLSFLSSNIYLPTYSNGLKEVGSFLGHTWKIPGSSGLIQFCNVMEVLARP